MNRNRMGMMQVTLGVLLAVGAWAMLGLVVVGPLMLAEYRENAKRAGCRMNLGSLGKALNMYSNNNDGKYPALADPATLAQGPIDEEPKFFGGTTAVKGNGSVNAYYLLVDKGYADADEFRCPSDDAYEAPRDRGKALGFNGWKNLSYALQPTNIDPAVFSSRPGPKSKVSMVIAADQVVDKATPLTTTDNRPKKTNDINHGYEYVNMLTMDGSTHVRIREWGSDGRVSRWGYDVDEIFTKTQSADPVKRVNDSILMGKEGGE
jgi:hypothetical protein